METIPTESFIAFSTSAIAVIALVVSIIALIYTAKTYLLKTGAYIRGAITRRSSIECNDDYFCKISLENQKDRAVAIFKIYLRIGHNIYIEIENFEERPLILHPFEVYHKEYEPIDFYIDGTEKIELNELLNNKKVKHKIILSTSEGKYIVKDFIKEWDPVILFFQNYATQIVRPVRSTYKGKSYGSNVKFIIEFHMEDGENEIVPIYPNDYRTRKFGHFLLTKKSLESKESLNKYLNLQVEKGGLKCKSLDVFNMESWRSDAYEMEQTNVITAKNITWFEYYIISRIKSKLSEYRLKRKVKSRKANKWDAKKVVQCPKNASMPKPSIPKRRPSVKNNKM